MDIQLRPPVDGDENFLFEVYSSTRQAELDLMPWPAQAKHDFVRMQFEAQKKHYRAYYPAADHSIVVIDGTPAGRLYVDRQASQILIIDFTLLPEFHRRGIGRAMISRLQKEAASTGKMLTGHVEKWNPARVFWQSMGFHVADGEEVHHPISWSGAAHRRPT